MLTIVSGLLAHGEPAVLDLSFDMRDAAGERHDCWSSLVGAIERYRVGGEGGIEESRSRAGSRDK